MHAAAPSAPERDILIVGGVVGKWRRQRNPRRFQPFGGTAEARNSMLVMPRICRTLASILRLALVLAASLGLALANQDSEGSESSQESIAKADASAQAAGIEVGQGAAGTATEPEQKGADRTELNLLGEVDNRWRGEQAQRKRPAHSRRQQRPEGNQHPDGHERNDRARIRPFPRLFWQRVRESVQAPDPPQARSPPRLPWFHLRDPRQQHLFRALVLPSRVRKAGANE